jgi:hypothetical protein
MHDSIALLLQAAQVDALQEEVALLKGDPGALRLCRVEQLQELVTQLEQSLGAARAAHLQVGAGGQQGETGAPIVMTWDTPS